MIAYKFLRAGAVAPFSGRLWEPPIQGHPGGWVEGGPVLQTCRSGVHACRPVQLAYWINDELWEVELAGRIVESELKLTAERGRLLRQLVLWGDELRDEFAAACAWRARHHALEELRTLALSEWVTRLESCTELRAASRLAGELAEVPELQRRRSTRDLLAYLADAVEYASSDVAATAYIAAVAAERRSTIHSGDPFAEEREWQASWLAERLRLDPQS
jgi:hypothetical protein